MQYWLMKSEPGEFSFADLKARPGRSEPWDGVRNYQARNMMRDQMKKGDLILFYHSNTDVPAIVGIARVVREGYPDSNAFDPEDKHYDPKSDPDNPRWYRVDVGFERDIKRPLSLQEIKSHTLQLNGLALIRRGNRLSVMPVAKAHWNYLLEMENQPEPPLKPPRKKR